MATLEIKDLHVDVRAGSDSDEVKETGSCAVAST